jgi:outer membrane protein assembly factor BamB
MNFASAQPVSLAGEELVLFCNESALLAIHPADGRIAFRHTPTGWNGPSMVQPQVIDENGLIVPLGDGVGVARLRVTKPKSDWSVTEDWSTKEFKPSFNDFVIHEGHLYGFDQSLFACLDATTGERRWKRGRYGFGQVLLLVDAGQLLVTTEEGELVLVAADPAAHRELGRLPVVSGKTWNHPALAHGRLYVRSEEEAACFELPLGSTVTPPAISAR